ncbi:MAG: hypothetical protein ACLPVY_18375 [Acidimicrobiia bacterium]
MALTDVQLRAHEGVGVPTGWAPVDGGDARLWVTAKWSVEYGAGCTDGSGRTDVAYVGLNSFAVCQPKGNPALQQAAAFTQPPRQSTGASSQIVNGYRVYPVNAAKPHRVWDVYDVPQLRVRIGLRGSLASRILGTLGPSSRTVALAFAVRPAETKLRTVEAQGVSLSISSSWTVVTPQALGCTSASNVLELIRPGMGAPSCDGPTGPGSVAEAVQVGGGGALATYPTKSPAVDRPPPSIVVLHHGKTTIRVFGDGDGQGSDSLGALIRLAGSPETHVLDLSLSRDGRVDGGILASIQANT